LANNPYTKWEKIDKRKSKTFGRWGGGRFYYIEQSKFVCPSTSCTLLGGNIGGFLLKEVAKGALPFANPKTAGRRSAEP
jgi:hypothetical protein